MRLGYGAGLIDAEHSTRASPSTAGNSRWDLSPRQGDRRDGEGDTRQEHSPCGTIATRAAAPSVGDAVLDGGPIRN